MFHAKMTISQDKVYSKHQNLNVSDTVSELFKSTLTPSSSLNCITWITSKSVLYIL